MKRKLFRSATLLIIAGALTKLLGFVRELVMAYVYGAGVVTDAFVIAFTIPSIALAFIGGSVASVYIPLYQNHKERKDLFTSNIVNLFLVIGLAFSLIFSFIPEVLVFLFASRLDPETFELASTLLRIMLWSAVPILLSEIYRGYLQIHNSFFVASIASVFVNGFVIIATILSGMTDMLYLLGVGTAVGNWLCLIMLFLSSKKRGLTYRLYFNLRDSSVNEMLILILPVFVTTTMGQLNQIIDRNFASSLAIGAISSLNYANKLVGLVTTLIGTVLGTVLFPRMSEFAANGDMKTLKRYLIGSVKKLAPLLLPLTVGVMIFAEPVVRLLFERGAFSPGDTKRTAEGLQMYALCITSGNINVLLVRAFYAIRKTKTPAVITVITVAINIALNFMLIAPFQHRGLALSTSAASTVALLLLLIALRRALGSLGLKHEWPEFFKTVIATTVMGVAVWLGYTALPVMGSGVLQCAAYTLGLSMMGMVLYALMHALMRTEIFCECMRQVRKFVSKGRGR